MNDLERYFEQNEGALIHKWMHYFEIYDRYFSRYRGTDVNVLEIGVSHGGSLQMWKDYFGPGASIYGVDIDSRCMDFEEDQIRIFIGDQADKEFLENLADDLPRIDILIDDGGHTMVQQAHTLEVMFPHIAQDGVYLCEDLHTSYWARYGAGHLHESSFVERTKALVDALNAWHSETELLTVSDFTRSAYGIHFYDSVVVIEKRPMSPPSATMTGRERL